MSTWQKWIDFSPTENNDDKLLLLFGVDGRDGRSVPGTEQSICMSVPDKTWSRVCQLGCIQSLRDRVGERGIRRREESTIYNMTN